MNLVVSKRATVAIAKTGNWIEQQNTEGSGERWINKVYHALETEARLGIKHAICLDENFARLNYRCFTYNDNWIVAYLIKGNNFIVQKFIYGPYLH